MHDDLQKLLDYVQPDEEEDAAHLEPGNENEIVEVCRRLRKQLGTTDLIYPDPGYAHRGEDNIRRVGTARAIYERYAIAHYGLRADRDDTSQVLSDLISDLLHLGLERGEDPVALLNRAATAFVGDFEDEPDEEIALAARAAHEELTARSGRVQWPPDDYVLPPEDLHDAWRRFQCGEEVTTAELRELDEWRADVNEGRRA